jgi:predicted RNA-binding protein with PIN domain
LAIRVIVDGYNLLNCARKWQRLANKDLASARTELLRCLSQYQIYKSHPILVVFDGGRGGWPTEQRDKLNNIDILYSRQGESADTVIKRMVSERGESAIVVTSDRELKDYVIRKGATVISSGNFESKLRTGVMPDACFEAEDEFYEVRKGRLTTKKKGNAYRRPKRERQIQAKLRKL